MVSAKLKLPHNSWICNLKFEIFDFEILEIFEKIIKLNSIPNQNFWTSSQQKQQQMLKNSPIECLAVVFSSVVVTKQVGAIFSKNE